jgi:hypothetical protein
MSDTLPQVNAKVFARKYIALGRIVTQWDEIMGADIASKAQPIKIHYRKSKEKNKRATAILEIATTSAMAADLTMKKDMLKG